MIIHAQALPITQHPALSLTVLEQCDSTNTELMQAARQGAASGTVITALHQTAGRGRRGSAWVAPAGGALPFSLLWRFSGNAQRLGGLSLAVGLAVARALHQLGAPSVQLKWPNDVVVAAHTAQGYTKLAGILVEVTGDAYETAAVIGVGLNLNLGVSLPPEIDQAATDLKRLTGIELEPSAVLHALLAELHTTLCVFEQAGLQALHNAWTALHLFHARQVSVRENGNEVLSGIVAGIDSGGALRVCTEVNGQSIEKLVYAGEVSLRLA
jgi:BirA family transcriptional regulator, biotin operon repressor / biotin---[acetyl-CoA-carboxylase] ligase